MKNKRSSEGLVAGAWVLIGFYDWEVRSDGSKKCDLLEIYSNMEKDKLKQLESRHLAELIKIDGGDAGNCTFSSFHIENKNGLEEEASSSDEEEHKKTPAPTALPALPVKKETAEEQLDWLSISDRDI